MSLFREWIPAAVMEDFTAFDRKEVYLEDGRSLALFKVEEEFFAVDGICSHAHALLVGGLREGYEIECPLHGARFDLRTGRHLSPPAVRGLSTYAVKVEDGKVYVKA